MLGYVTLNFNKKVSKDDLLNYRTCLKLRKEILKYMKSLNDEIIRLYEKNLDAVNILKNTLDHIERNIQHSKNVTVPLLLYRQSENQINKFENIQNAVNTEFYWNCESIKYYSSKSDQLLYIMNCIGYLNYYDLEIQGNKISLNLDTFYERIIEENLLDRLYVKNNHKIIKSSFFAPISDFYKFIKGDIPRIPYLQHNIIKKLGTRLITTTLSYLIVNYTIGKVLNNLLNNQIFNRLISGTVAYLVGTYAATSARINRVQYDKEFEENWTKFDEASKIAEGYTKNNLLSRMFFRELVHDDSVRIIYKQNTPNII